MSWSVSYIGTPDKVVIAAETYGATLTGQSKTEFDAAFPSIKTLIELNANIHQSPTLKVEASGHAFLSDGVQQYGNCFVKIQHLDGYLV